MINKKLKERYTIIKEVGRGGFGCTYLAKDGNNADSLCIVKQLNPYNADISTASRLFQREAETLKELRQADQIPEFIEYFEENDNYYIIQEYIEGKTLDKLIEETWDSENLSRFLWDVLSVLEKLHASNIVHRDIKPSNLIKSDRNCKIVVIDFGAVKQLDISQNIVSSSQESRVLNPPTATKIATAEYAPPEQKKGKPLLNSDIYALGMTALQLLTKKNPINIKRDNNDDIIFERAFDNVDPPLLAILNQMVKNDSRRRYQSASEVLKAIDSRKKEAELPVIDNSSITGARQDRAAIGTTEPWFSKVKEQKVAQTETILSTADIQTNHKHTNSLSTEPLSNIQENNTIRNGVREQSKKTNLNNSYTENNSASNLSTISPQPKSIFIPLSVIGLIIISEFISPWIRPAYFAFQGNRLFRQNKIEASLEQFYKVTSLKENSFRGWKGQGDALLTLGRVSGALGSYEKAISIKPNNIKTLNNLGKVYYEQGNYQKALEAHQQVIEIDSKNAEALNGKGIAYLGLREYEESLSAFDEAKKIKPNEPDIWLKKAIALQYLNLPEEAAELYKEALNVYNSITKNQPSDPILWADRGYVLQQLNLQQEALESYEQALTVNEDFYEALLGKANTLVVLQKPEEALSTLEKAAEVRPKDYQVWYTQGTVLAQVLQKHEEALTALDKATVLNPKFAPAWLNKGLALIALEQNEEALIALDKAKDLEPQNPYIWQNRGLVLQNLERPLESNESYQKASELGLSATP